MQNNDIVFSSELNVQLVNIMASDDEVIEAAKVSTLNDASTALMNDESKYGFINFLMKNRHGSPFERSVFKFRIEAPIFVWREFMRHRIASYNEQSGRYTKMPAKFYVPNSDRKIIQTGKTGEYNFELGTPEQYNSIDATMHNSCYDSYAAYEKLLSKGIAKEVARMVLPVNIYSIAYVTMNSRALMNFLSLRVLSGDSAYKSFPMWEIHNVAQQMETCFANIMPLTHKSFIKNGRVQP